MNAELTAKLDKLAMHCEGVVAADRHSKRVVYACEKAHATTGYKMGALIGENLNVLMPPSMRFLHDNVLDDYMLVAGTTSRDMATRMVAARQHNGQMREVEIVIQAIDDHPVAALFHNVDRMAVFRAVRDAL